MLVYLLYGAVLAVLLLGVAGVWRLSKRRRDIELPPGEQPPALDEKTPAALPPAAVQPEPAGRKGRKVREDQPTDEPPRAVAEPEEKPRALREGLGKTRGGFISRIVGLLGSKKIDASLLDQLEEVLLTADIGVKTSQKLFEAVRGKLSRGDLQEPSVVWDAIREESRRCLGDAPAPIEVGRSSPFVILVIGVNGSGKTTTIGKLAARWAGEGKKVMLAAGDTFRAAATEQLEIWGQRVGAPVVKGKEGADPSAVIFDAVKRAKAEGYDIVLADTAGRLHTKSDLMEELQKVRRVIQKAEPTAPHETILVVDSTNGQNAIAQAQQFKQAMDITGIILTKLDGTAKGGVILGICDELKLPVRFVGIGEKVADLRPFDPAEFVSALYEGQDA